MSGLHDRFHLYNSYNTIVATVIPTKQGTFNIIGYKHYLTENNASRAKLEAYMNRQNLTSDEPDLQVNIWDVISGV